MLVIDIGCIPIPGHYPTTVIHQPAELDAEDPTTFVRTFLANLLDTPAFSDLNSSSMGYVSITVNKLGSATNATHQP